MNQIEATYIYCPECDYAYTGDSCPNPACFKGAKEYQMAMVNWQSAKQRYFDEHRGFQFQALTEMFVRENPKPTRAQFEINA